jgi:hypothetical protein
MLTALILRSRYGSSVNSKCTVRSVFNLDICLKSLDFTEQNMHVYFLCLYRTPSKIKQNHLETTTDLRIVYVHGISSYEHATMRFGRVYLERHGFPHWQLDPALRRD